MGFRNARESDYRPIIDVIDMWWRGRHMADLLPKLFFQHFQNTSFVVEEDDEIIGFVVGFISQTDPVQSYIHFVGVHPEYRKHGLARQLYERFFDEALQRGCTEVRCVTSRMNEMSIAFHTKMGFRIEEGNAEVNGIQVQKDYDGQAQSRVRFVRSLLAPSTNNTSATALLVVDVQVAMFDKADPVHHGTQLLINISALIDGARHANVPVIYVQHCNGEGAPLERGTPGWQIHPKIAPSATDVVIEKCTPDSFHGTTLDATLRQQQIKRIVLCGIQSDICIDTTCRRAFSLGYDVILAADAHSTWPCAGLLSEQIVQHENAVLRWFADVKPTEDISFAMSF